MSNEQRVTFRLPQNLADQLKQLSDQRGVAVAKIVRDVLQRYLDRQY